MARRQRRPAPHRSNLSYSLTMSKASGQLQPLALLRRENSLPFLPDMSMFDVKRSAGKAEGDLQQKGSDCEEGAGGLLQQRRKMWVETEQELDALRQALRPRRKYVLARSQSVAPVAPSPPPNMPISQTHDTYIAPNPIPYRVKKPLLQLFPNLPKLPFGQHKSYNDVPDRSQLFVLVKPTRRVRKVIGRPFKQA